MSLKNTLCVAMVALGVVCLALAVASYASSANVSTLTTITFYMSLTAAAIYSFLLIVSERRYELVVAAVAWIITAALYGDLVFRVMPWWH